MTLKNTLILLILFIIVDIFNGESTDDSSEILFRKFIEKYHKHYSTETEFQFRYEAFKFNLKEIEMLQNHEQGTAKYGINKFSDLTHNEKGFYQGNSEINYYNINNLKTSYDTLSTFEIPDNFDWRDHGVVTPVKNQLICGSCWAFSTTGNIEGQYAIKYGELISFSEEELLECDKIDEGCIGGLPWTAYLVIHLLGGLESEDDYPYTGNDEHKCALNKTQIIVQIANRVKISSDENEMMEWLVKNGPISVGMNADPLQSYTEGVMHPTIQDCDPTKLHHGVLIVGYGVENGQPYWLVKNSWGQDWGLEGYFKLYRGDGTCGINTAATSAVIA